MDSATIDEAANAKAQRQAPLWFTENGALVADGGIVVGSVARPDSPLDGIVGTSPTLVLDLGWLRAAGVRLQVFGDRSVDRRSIVLER